MRGPLAREIANAFVTVEDMGTLEKLGVVRGRCRVRACAAGGIVNLRCAAGARGGAQVGHALTHGAHEINEPVGY